MTIMGTIRPPILMLGLTAQNVEMLKKGKPIRVTAVTHPVAKDIIGGMQIVIFYGETEEAIRKEMTEAGLIGEDTVVSDTSQEKPKPFRN